MSKNFEISDCLQGADSCRLTRVMLKRLSRHPFRFTGKFIHLFTTLTCAGLDAAQLNFRKKLNLQQKNQWQSKWSQNILRALRIQVRFEGSPPSKGMLVANHGVTFGAPLPGNSQARFRPSLKRRVTSRPAYLQPLNSTKSHLWV